MNRDALRHDLYEEQGGLCWLCDRRMRLMKGTRDAHPPDAATFDHVVTKADGGSDDRDNLRLAHKLCNNLRGRLTPGEARALIRRRAIEYGRQRPASTRPSEAMPFTRQWLIDRGYMNG
jgi:5-methylcytosine-specific restriction endonuclease McrA